MEIKYLTIFSARPHGTLPLNVEQLSARINVPASSIFLFPMFDEEPYDFHYSIDSFDIKDISIYDKERIVEAMNGVMVSSTYFLSWCMLEGSLQDVDELFKNTWEVANTFAICFKGEKPKVEIDAARRAKPDWNDIMNKATLVLQK
jgi:hypothetical protein